VLPIVKLVVITLLESMKLAAPHDDCFPLRIEILGAAASTKKLIGPLRHESPAMEAVCLKTSPSIVVVLVGERHSWREHTRRKIHF